MDEMTRAERINDPDSTCSPLMDMYVAVPFE